MKSNASVIKAEQGKKNNTKKSWGENEKIDKLFRKIWNKFIRQARAKQEE